MMTFFNILQRNPRLSGRSIGPLLGVSLVVFGCGPTTPQLRATAANEMNCPVSELDLEHIDSRSMAVVGCGREKIYSKYCDKTADGKVCGWRSQPEQSEER